MSDTDVPVLAALVEVEPPPAGSAGARFLHAAWSGDPDAVPSGDAELWRTWVDLALWQRTAPAGPVDLTAHARADLAALATRLGRGPVPEQGAGVVARRGLTGEQDARLRTLAALRELGDLAPELQQLRSSLRERDQRAAVRPPAPVTWPGRRGTGEQA